MPILTTATRFLSFHDLNRVPSVTRFAARITVPVLWLSASNDPLTTNQNHAGLAALITSAKSEYQLIVADHFGIVAASPTAIDNWLAGL